MEAVLLNSKFYISDLRLSGGPNQYRKHQCRHTQLDFIEKLSTGTAELSNTAIVAEQGIQKHKQDTEKLLTKMLNGPEKQWAKEDEDPETSTKGDRKLREAETKDE